MRSPKDCQRQQTADGNCRSWRSAPRLFSPGPWWLAVYQFNSNGTLTKANLAGSTTLKSTRISRLQRINPYLFKFWIASVAVLIAFGIGVKTYQWSQYRLTRLPQTWQNWTAPSPEPPIDNAATPQQLSNLLADGSILLRTEAANAYWDMVAAAQAEGIELYVLAGYREPSQSEGQSEDQSEVSSSAEGDSFGVVNDYHTGYAIDIGGDEEATDRQPSFEDTDAFKWLEANAQTYGFELSPHKKGLIGGAFEPWHWRYRPQTAPSVN